MINRYKYIKAYKRFKPNPAYMDLGYDYAKAIRAKLRIDKLSKLLEERFAKDQESAQELQPRQQTLEQMIEARKASEAILEAKQKTKWEKKASSTFPRKRYQSMWDNVSKKSRKFILPKAIAAFATVDGIEKAVDAIKYGMNVPGVKMDFGFVIKFLNKMTHIELAKYLLTRSNLPNSNRREILSSLIAQEFPPANIKEPNYIKDMRQALKAVSQDKQNEEAAANRFRPIRELQGKESIKGRTPRVKEKPTQRKEEAG